MNIFSPMDLYKVRSYFETVFHGEDFTESDVPATVNVIGLVSGYRRVQTDPDLTQVFLEISQGFNEEYRLTYVGKFPCAQNYPIISVVSERLLLFH